MVTCITHKKVYPCESSAEEALLGAWITYSYRNRSGPVAVYLCEDCGLYHLTSKGPMNKKLADQLASGKIQQQKDTDFWMDKIKKGRK